MKEQNNAEPLLQNSENNKPKVEEQKNINVDEKEQKIISKSIWDFWYGFSFLGRLIFTLYSLHGLFLIYNFVIQYIVAFPSLLYTIDMGPVGAFFFSLIYILFAINSSNLLVIPTFEFFSFPFLLYKQPFAHIISFLYTYKGIKYTDEDVKQHYNEYSTVLFIFFELVYLAGLLCVYIFAIGIVKDITKLVILILIYVYYIIIILSYFCFSLYIIWNAGKELCKKKGKMGDIINSLFKDKEISNLNLYNNVINPFLMKNYKDKYDKSLDVEEEDEKPKENKNQEQEDVNENVVMEVKKKKCLFENSCFELVTKSKILTLVFSLVCFIIISASLFNFWLDYIIFFFIYIIMTILSMTLNFPFCYRNRKTFGTCCFCPCCCCCEKGTNNCISSNIQYDNKSMHSIVVSFARLLSNVIILLAAAVFVLIYFFNRTTEIKQLKYFRSIEPSKVPIDSKKLLLPNICYSSVHNMPLPLFLPFINDAYYYDNIDGSATQETFKSSFEIDEYRKLFFDDDYVIDIRGNLIKKDKHDTVTMVQYNVKNKKDYLTILAIKGTSYSTDIYLDAQLYVSSIFLSILSAFSISTQKDSLTFGLMEYGLNIPYRLFFKFLIIDKYMNDLREAYVKNEYSFFQNVVIVGHSLGGGLAKLF